MHSGRLFFLGFIIVGIGYLLISWLCEMTLTMFGGGKNDGIWVSILSASCENEVFLDVPRLSSQNLGDSPIPLLLELTFPLNTVLPRQGGEK
jgi:hypothetical protein